MTTLRKSPRLSEPIRRVLIIGTINYLVLNLLLVSLKIYTGDSYDELFLRAARSLAVISVISNNINEALPSITQTFEDLNEVRNVLEDLSNGEASLNDVIPTISNALDDMNDVAGTLHEIKGVKDNMDADQIPHTLDEVMESISNTLDTMESIGNTIGESLPNESISNTINGVKNAASTLGDVSASIADALDTVESTIDEVMADVEMPDDVQVPESISNTINDVKNAASKLGGVSASIADTLQNDEANNSEMLLAQGGSRKKGANNWLLNKLKRRKRS